MKNLNISDLRVGDVIQDTRPQYLDEWRILSIDGYGKIRMECTMITKTGFPNLRIGHVGVFSGEFLSHYQIINRKHNNFKILYDKLL